MTSHTEDTEFRKQFLITKVFFNITGRGKASRLHFFLFLIFFVAGLVGLYVALGYWGRLSLGLAAEVLQFEGIQLTEIFSQLAPLSLLIGKTSALLLGLFVILHGLFVLYYIFAVVSLKRLNDAGYSSWWIVLPFVPLFLCSFSKSAYSKPAYISSKNPAKNSDEDNIQKNKAEEETEKNEKETEKPELKKTEKKDEKEKNSEKHVADIKASTKKRDNKNSKPKTARTASPNSPAQNSPAQNPSDKLNKSSAASTKPAPKILAGIKSGSPRRKRKKLQAGKKS